MSHLILASTSKYRAALLRRWQLSFETVDPKINEDAFKAQGLSPTMLVQTLSEAKAQAVAKSHPSSVVIGSDQVLCHGNCVYGKTANKERAVAELMQLRGQSQELLTGLCVVAAGQTFYHLDRTEIRLREFTETEARLVVERDQSWDCAGSLKIEASGTWLIDSLKTTDPSAIEGLPLIALGKMLRDLGLSLALFGG